MIWVENFWQLSRCETKCEKRHVHTFVHPETTTRSSRYTAGWGTSGEFLRRIFRAPPRVTATTRFPSALFGLTVAGVRVPLFAHVSSAHHSKIHMSASKRPSEVIDLSSEEEEPVAPKRQATAVLPTRLRGVPCPEGWGVHAGSLLVWRHLSPQPASKIAAFDFDGCLARTLLGGNDPNAWSMQFPHVPAVLATLVANGYSVVVVTNESMDRFKKPEAVAKAIAKKCGRLEGFAKAAGVPLLVLCATAKDEFRKPNIGCWNYLTGTVQAGHEVDLASSFFVGDAAGRVGYARTSGLSSSALPRPFALLSLNVFGSILAAAATTATVIRRLPPQSDCRSSMRRPSFASATRRET